MQTPDYFINFDPKAHQDDNLHFYEPAGTNEDFGPGPGVVKKVTPTPGGPQNVAKAGDEDSDEDEDISYKGDNEKDDDDISYDGNPPEPAKAKQNVKPLDTLDDDISYDGNHDKSADDLSYDGNTNNNKNNLATNAKPKATIEDDLSYGDDGANSDISA